MANSIKETFGIERTWRDHSACRYPGSNLLEGVSGQPGWKTMPGAGCGIRYTCKWIEIKRKELRAAYYSEFLFIFLNCSQDLLLFFLKM